MMDQWEQRGGCTGKARLEAERPTGRMMQSSSGLMSAQACCGTGLGGKGAGVAPAATTLVIVRPGTEQLGFNVGATAILGAPDLLTAVLSTQRQSGHGCTGPPDVGDS